MKQFFKSLLVAFCALVAFAPAYADEVCQNLWDNTQTVGSQYVNNTVWQKYNVSLPIGNGTWTTRHISNVQPGTYSYSSDTGSVYSIITYDGTNATKLTVSPTGGTFTLTTPSEVWLFWPNPTAAASSTDIVIKPSICGTCDGIIKTYESVAAADVPAGVQNGTPTPTNPIEPVFYQQGDMVLRRIGDYADSYDATTGKITRRIGVKVFDGTENWSTSSATNYLYTMEISNSNTANTYVPYSTHFQGVYGSVAFANIQDGQFKHGSNSTGWYFKATNFETLTNFKSWLAEQYANGTPVTVYYPLATPVEEDWSSSYCRHPIKIATTKYSNAQFNPVITNLNTAVSTIKDVVSNTITQTAAIAQIASDKQTRPDSACPAGKTCLLVEDVNGDPHWYEIIEEYIPPEPVEQ